MDVLAFGAKALLAVILLAAGGGKLADIAGFGSTVRLFVPGTASTGTIRACAFAIALGEAILGCVSLAWPTLAWLNIAVLALTCCFLGVSAIGYGAFRGRSCNCFGSLSRRKFDLAGLGRSAMIAALAFAPVLVGTDDVRTGGAARGLLASSAILLAYTSFTAARALSAAATGGGVR